MYVKVKKKVRNPKHLWRRLLNLLLIPMLCLNMGIFSVSPAKADQISERLIYVAETGNDFSGNGTSDSPYRSIKKAAAEATPGTKVLIRPGTYIEDDIRPGVSGREDAMITFRPEKASDVGKVIIKHRDVFDGSSITPAVKDQWLRDMGWNEGMIGHYDNAGIEYSIAGQKNELTDVFNLYQRDYIWIEGFVFRDYKYARNTININGTGNVIINNRFENLGCVYSTPWHWAADGVFRGDVTMPVSGKLNVVRNNYFQNIYGETLCYDGGSQDNIITENTFIGAIGKNSGAAGSESSTLGGRFENNYRNAFAFNYSGGSVNGGTIWLDVCVRDFTAVRNVAHNTAYFMFNESGCERNWAYENIIYNKPLDANGRMPASPEFFTDFPAQRIESGLFTAFWDTGSTWDARWVNNVAYNLKQGICLDRSWRDVVRNNIAYEDEYSMYNPAETYGIMVKETSVNGYHPWHGIDLKGGGPQIYRNNLWYSTRKRDFVRYMEAKQPGITVDAFNAQINSKTELGKDPMFENAPAGDFRLKPGSPAIGTGDNGVDRGAYAVYPKTDVGCNTNRGLTEDINVSFTQLNSLVKPDETAELELKLNKPASGTLDFEVVPVAGDARIDKDFAFLDNPKVSFSAGEQSKTVRVKIIEGYDLDQLLGLRIQPAGSTPLEAVGARNLHLIRIKRVLKSTLTVNDIGDYMGHSLVEYYYPGEIVTVDAKTRPGYTFAGWETGYHGVKLPLADERSPRTTFVMPEWNPTIRAKWTVNGGYVNVAGVGLNHESLSLKTGEKSGITATVYPDNASDKVVIWTSSNPLVAAVDENGIVTGRSAGTAEITATALESSDRQITAKCKVFVEGKSPEVGDTIEAEYYSVQSGVDTEDCEEGGSDVAYIEDGDYIGFKNVDFGNGVNSVKFRVASIDGGSKIEVRLGAPDGKLIGSLDVGSTGGWQEWTTQRCSINTTTGVNDVYLVFKGDSGYLFNLNWWSLDDSKSVQGDCNADGQFNSADVILLMRWMVSKEKNLPDKDAADMNNDGKINIADLCMMKSVLLGINF